MDIKVGDIVSYNNNHARVMRIIEDDEDGEYKAHLVAQKLDIHIPLDELELIESVELSNFEPGDLVIVRNIPQYEKELYGCGWLTSMNKILDGEPHTIKHVVTHEEEGIIVQIKGCWFQTYHVEHVQNYDIV